MLKRIRISVLAPTLLPNNLVHYATIFKISKSIDFTGVDVIINSTETTNLYDNNFTVDIKEDDNLYVVTQYVYKEVDTNGVVLKDIDGNDIIKLGTPSRISSVRGNQEGVKISDTIVETPTVIIGSSYKYNIDGNIMLKTSDFKMFSSSGIHKASTWIIKDLSGKILFKREYDLDNLTSIILGDEFKLEDNFIVYACHHSSTNADSNYGLKENIISNELPKYKVKPINKFIVGRHLYFNVELFNKRFKNLNLDIKDVNGVITNINNISKTILKVDTSDFIEKVNYEFKFTFTSENDIDTEVIVNLFSHGYKDLYDKNKVYLDAYNYIGLLLTNGEVNNFSYELSNGSIILQKNITDYIVNSQFNNNSIIYLNNISTITTEDVYTPNVYVNELLNGDVIICYKDNLGDVKIGLFTLDPINNILTKKSESILESQEPLSYSGGVTIVKNDVYYIDYNTSPVKLVKYNPYTSDKTYYALPYTALHGIGLATNLDGNIIIAGGTDTAISDYNTIHNRINNKAYLFNTTTNQYNEIGSDILQTLPVEIFQFHMVYRHDNKITLFNNVGDTNYDIVGDQTTYVLDFTNNTLDNKLNDHLDKIPYNNTIVLRNGDVIRFSNLVKDPQKMYLYISDSMNADGIVDNNTLVYDANKIVIESGETLHIDKPCMYDSIKVNPGGYVTLGDDAKTKYDSTVLLVTRDMVLTQLEFEAAHYSMVYKICSDARFILLG